MILHITNDYSGSTVYQNLCKELDHLGVAQIVYNPVLDPKRIGKNRIEFKTPSSQIIYSPILSLYTRLNYRAKINRQLKDIHQKIDLKEIKFIHAHTWFSDGGVAYEIYKKYKIPYCITVRNTDLNIFFKYMLHLRSYGVEILKHASKVIFISPVYIDRVKALPFLQKYSTELEQKYIFIPNGIDEFWIENIQKRKQKISKPVRLLYIGKFTRGKNVLRLAKAVEKLNQQGVDCQLDIIGGGGKQQEKVTNFIHNKPIFTFHGIIKEKEKLQQMFKNADIFTMPSMTETFGLVYIEALSQGIPVVYTKNEGIYGTYDHTIGEAVGWMHIDAIAEGIKKIATHYADYNFDPQQIVVNHNWKTIAQQKYNLYKKFI